MMRERDPDRLRRAGVMPAKPGDIPVAGDVNGDGVAGFGIWRIVNGSDGTWYFDSGANGQHTTIWGAVHGGPSRARRLRVLSYRVMLDVPFQLALFVSGLARPYLKDLPFLADCGYEGVGLGVGVSRDARSHTV